MISDNVFRHDSSRGINNAEGVGQFQPRVGARATTLGTLQRESIEPCKGYSRAGLTLAGLICFFMIDTQGCRFASNLGLKLANAFGVLANSL